MKINYSISVKLFADKLKLQELLSFEIETQMYVESHPGVQIHSALW